MTWLTRLMPHVAALGACLLLLACAMPPAAPATQPQSLEGHPFLVDILPTAPPAAFAMKCGNGFCDTRTSYCETVKTDVALLPNDYACRPLPQSCKGSSSPASGQCGCFPQGTRCDFCTVQKAGDGDAFYRTCIGGR